MKKKINIIIAIVNVLLLMLIGVCVFRCDSIGKTLNSQKAAERWAGDRDQRFAQVSCFYPVGQEKTEEQVRTFRETVDKKLAEAGVEAPEQGSYWTDAYAAISSAQTKGERGSSEATAIGVGGDFFLFHPYNLLSGSYISDEDVMLDRVVIDRELAWKLFGGTVLDGMTMEVNGRLCYIAGVVERETDRFSQRCFSNKPLVFMHCSRLYGEDGAASINCYEMAMLDPISGFALKTVSEGMANDDVAVVENSKRYSFNSIYQIFKNFGDRSIQSKAVVLPYWENAARVSEVYVARLYLVIALLALIPFIFAVVLMVKLIKLIIGAINRGKAQAKEAWEDRYGRREARREKRAAKKAVKKPKDAGKKRKTNLRKTKLKVKKHRRKSAPEEPAKWTDNSAESGIVSNVESIVRQVLNEE